MSKQLSYTAVSEHHSLGLERALAFSFTSAGRFTSLCKGSCTLEVCSAARGFAVSRNHWNVAHHPLSYHLPLLDCHVVKVRMMRKEGSVNNLTS